MGKAGKRQEMVEAQCMQEMHIEVRPVRERVPCKSVVIESCVKMLWVKHWCATGAGVKILIVQVLHAMNATPATQSAGRCRQVPHLPLCVDKLFVVCRHVVCV